MTFSSIPSSPAVPYSEKNLLLKLFRNSHQWCSVNIKVFPENFAKLTGNHLCQSLFSIQLQALRPRFLKSISVGCFLVFPNFQESTHNKAIFSEVLSVGGLLTCMVLKNKTNTFRVTIFQVTDSTFFTVSNCRQSFLPKR